MFLLGYEKFCTLWEICTIVCTLSHGQGNVERSFSSNKEILTKNVGHTTIMAQHMMHDHLIIENKKIYDIEITNNLILNILHQGKILPWRKKVKVSSDKIKKRNIKQDKIKKVKRRMLSLINCISERQKAINKILLKQSRRKICRSFQRQMHLRHLLVK